MAYSSYSKYGKRRRTTTGYTRYKKRYTRTRSAARRTPYDRPSNYTVTPNSQITRMLPGTYRTTKSWVRGVPGVIETKNWDSFYMGIPTIDDGNSSLLTSWQDQSAVHNHTLVPQNVTKNGRIGRKIAANNIRLRWNAQAYVTSNANADFQCFMARFVCVLDTQTNGTAFAITDVLDYSLIGNYAAGPPIIYPNKSGCQTLSNLDNVGRFKILVDRKYTRAPIAVWSNADPLQNLGMVYECISDKANIKLKGLPIEYSADTGALSEIRSNSISSFWIFYRMGTATVTPTVASAGAEITIQHNTYARLGFVDP